MIIMPANVAQIRQEACPSCDCSTANPLNPCSACPKGNWGPWMRCEPDSPVPEPAPGFPAPVAAPRSDGGVGTELKAMLAKFWIKSAPGCHCDHRARIMDAEGPDWCEQNLKTILAWLKEEADRRKLPFLESAARLLIRRAIGKTRRLQAACKASTTPLQPEAKTGQTQPKSSNL